MLAIILFVADLDAAWKSRAMLAAERLGQAPDACEKALETAFALHITDEKLVKKANNDALFYHLVLTARKDSVFDFAYVYERKAGDKVVGARVTELPKKWMLALMDASKLIVRTDTGCTYELDSKDPFAARTVRAPAVH